MFTQKRALSFILDLGKNSAIFIWRCNYYEALTLMIITLKFRFASLGPHLHFQGSEVENDIQTW